MLCQGRNKHGSVPYPKNTDEHNIHYINIYWAGNMVKNPLTWSLYPTNNLSEVTVLCDKLNNI